MYLIVLTGSLVLGGFFVCMAWAYQKREKGIKMKKRDQAIGFLVVFLAAGMLISCGRSREVEQDAEARVEEAFTENGITDFEKMDLIGV